MTVTLDGFGHATAKFTVDKPASEATFGHSVRHGKEGGGFGDPETGSTKVPTGTPGTHGPAPPAQFGSAECPVPE